jgi:AMP-binding enzyme.
MTLTKKAIIDKIPLEVFLHEGTKINGDIETVYYDKLASNIAFTSGTTGQNKAVLLSHDANNALAFQHTMAKLGLERGKKHLGFSSSISCILDF